MIFEKGDIVECKNASGSLYTLVKGKTYRVESVSIKNSLKLVGVEGNWRSYRFTHTKQSIVNKIINDL